MMWNAPRASRPVRLALASGAGFFVAACASNFSVMQGNGLTAVWAGNGVLLGILLRCSRNGADVAGACIGAFLASVLSSALLWHGPNIAMIFAAANIVEVLLALAVLRRMGVSTALGRVHDVVALMLACLVAPLASGLIGASTLTLANHVSFVAGFFGWYLASMLGLAMVTPGVVAVFELADAVRTHPLRARQAGEIVVILGLVAGGAIHVFYGSRHPSTFLLTPLILLATFRLRQFGAVAAVGIVALIAATATSHGFGPIAVWKTMSLSGQAIYLQTFLAATFISALPVAAALAERDARAEEAHMIADHFKAVVENITEVIFRTDCAGRWTYLNPAWEKLSGYDVAASIGRSWKAVIDPEAHAEVADWARPVYAGEVSWTRRLVRFHTAAGAMRWMELSIHGLRDTDGEVIGSTGTLRDVHDRKRLEEQVLSAKRLAEERERAATLLAATDELTGLPNRRAFLAHLDRQVGVAGETGFPLAVAIFDVDHFKAVNDRHGHAVGDRVLERVAARAVAIVRGGDIVGRIGGEEFSIVMPGADVAAATAVADRLRAAIGEDDDGHDLPSVTVSVGLAIYSFGQSGPALLAEADAALYEAKGDGRNRTKIAA